MRYPVQHIFSQIILDKQCVLSNEGAASLQLKNLMTTKNIFMLPRDIIWCKLPGTIFPPPVIIDEMISNDGGAIFDRQRNETLASVW